MKYVADTPPQSDDPFELREFINRELQRIAASFDTLIEERKFIEATALATADSPYDVLFEDINLFCAPDTGAMTLNLPAGINKRIYRAKNYASTGANTVTLVPNGTETIEGLPTLVLGKGDSAQIVFIEARSDWFII